MKRTKKDDVMIRRFLNEEEGEEDLFGDTEEEAEEATDEEETAEGAEGTEDEDSPDETGDDEAADKSDADKQQEPTPRVDSVLDAEINSVLIDFEKKALDEYEGEDSEIEESSSLYSKGLGLLLEEEKPVEQPIDIEVFAGEVARLIKNYENLLDMEALLQKKAVDYIKSKYDEELAERLVDSLEEKHGISIKSPVEKEEDLEAPIAVGASKEAASG